MGEPRDSNWYHAEADRVRRKAGVTADPGLREDYLKLVEAYQSLAETLERVSYHPEPRS